VTSELLSAVECVMVGRLGVFLSGLMLLVAVPGAAAQEQPASDPDVATLVARYAPILYLGVQPQPCDANGEPYFPIPVEVILGNEQIALVDDDPERVVVGYGATAGDIFRRDDTAYLDYPGNPRSPGCTYEHDFRALLPQPAVTYAHVISDPDETGIALQYWFFYYFNGGDNTHEGDWEGIQLSWDAATVAEALTREPDRAAYAQHGGGEIAEWTDEKVRTEDGHPVVFVANGSHASYFDDDVFLMYGEAGTGLGCDDASGPAYRLAPSPVLVPTTVADQDDPAAWVTYDGRWGQRETSIWDGPTGPNTKGRWTEPLDWEENLRDFSYSVGENNSGGLSPVNVFCNLISFGGRLANLDATHPWLARSLLAAAFAGLIALLFVARDVLGGAARLYLRHPIVFLGLGLTVFPVAFVINLFQVALTYLPPVEFVVKLTERSPTTWLLYALSAFGLLHLPVLIFVGPAVAQAVTEAGGGGRPRFLSTCRRTLDRLRPLAGAALRAWLIVVGLVISVIGLPWAIVRAVRWAFVGQAVVLDGAPTPTAAARTSAAAVAGHWWRSLAILVVLILLEAGIPPLLGVVLMFTSDLSLAWVTTISGLIAAATIPFVTIGMTLLYRDLTGAKVARARQARGERIVAASPIPSDV
jgi:hypothetical protein